MATLTPNLGLRKPSDVDFVNVDTDVNDNMDIIDDNPGIKTVTDKTAIDALDKWAGRKAFAENEGDFGIYFFCDGTVWKPVSEQVISIFTDSGSISRELLVADLGFNTLKLKIHGFLSTVDVIFIRVNDKSAVTSYRGVMNGINEQGNAFVQRNDSGGSASGVAFAKWGTVNGCSAVGEFFRASDSFQYHGFLCQSSRPDSQFSQTVHSSYRADLGAAEKITKLTLRTVGGTTFDIDQGILIGV